MRKSSTYHHGNLKNAALSVAFELVSQEGYKALTLKVVAERLGVSAPSLYRHYRSREDLLLSVIAETFRQLNKRLQKAAAATPEPSRRPAAIATAILDFGEENPKLYQLINELEVSAEHTEAMAATQVVDETIDRAFTDAHPGMSKRQLRIQTLLMWFFLYGFFAVQQNQPSRSALVDRSDLEDLRRRLISMATQVNRDDSELRFVGIDRA